MLPAGIVKLPVTGTHVVPLKYSSVVAVSVPTVAVPELRLSVNVVALKLGFDKLIVNRAWSLSNTIGFEMLNVGGPSLSIMVARPVALTLLVTPAVVVAVKVKVSLFSLKTSSLSGVRTNTLVLLAAMVTEVAFCHVAPPSVDTCRFVAPAAP